MSTDVVDQIDRIAAGAAGWSNSLTGGSRLGAGIGQSLVVGTAASGVQGGSHSNVGVFDIDTHTGSPACTYAPFGLDVPNQEVAS